MSRSDSVELACLCFVLFVFVLCVFSFRFSRIYLHEGDVGECLSRRLEQDEVRRVLLQVLVHLNVVGRIATHRLAVERAQPLRREVAVCVCVCVCVCVSECVYV